MYTFAYLNRIKPLFLLKKNLRKEKYIAKLRPLLNDQPNQ